MRQASSPSSDGVIGGFLLVAALAPLAFAQAPAPAEKRVALVIGNGRYANSPLRNPVNDARAIDDDLVGPARRQ